MFFADEITFSTLSPFLSLTVLKALRLSCSEPIAAAGSLMGRRSLFLLKELPAQES